MHSMTAFANPAKKNQNKQTNKFNFKMCAGMGPGVQIMRNSIKMSKFYTF